MKLQLVQFRPEPNDKDGNLGRILRYIDEGLAVGANLIAFGEQALVGYDLNGKIRYGELAEPIPGPVTDKVAAKIRGKNCMVLFGMPESDRGDIYNSAPLIGPEGVIGVAQKLYLANFMSILTGVTYTEGVHFKPGKRISYWDTSFGRIGVEVCLDAYHPEISYAHAIAGCWLILQPSATPLMSAEAPIPSPISLARGFECISCVAYVNITGDQLGQPYQGGTHIILGPAGCKKILSYGKDAHEEVLQYEVDPGEVYKMRARFPMIRDARPDLMKQLWEITTQARYGD